MKPPTHPDEEENRLIAQRREKLSDSRRAGFDYPNHFVRNAHAGELAALYGDWSPERLEEHPIRVAVAGRLMARRLMGRAAFADLRDFSGRIQIYGRNGGEAGGGQNPLEGLDIGDLVGITGSLMKTRTGELTIQADTTTLLAKNLRPLPEKYHGLVDPEQRYRRRYVDLIMNEDTRRVFQQRSQIVTHLRRYLDSLGFLEVETPMMHPLPGGALARPFVTHHEALDLDLFLRVAPELYLKRLIVGGFERVYEINRNFRNEGVSTRHNPEFTMLELYQAYANAHEMMSLTERMIRSAAEQVLGRQQVVVESGEVDLAPPFARKTMVELVGEYNPGLDGARIRDAAYLGQVLASRGLAVSPQAGDAGTLLMELFEATVEPKLRDPVFVTDYPLAVSPLARRATDPFFADRFELYIGGRELANGFSELNDPEDQADRFRAQLRAREAGQDEAMHFDQDYIEALEYGMPPTGGLGVGIDRLVMLLTGRSSIREVLLFPLLKPA